MTSKNTRSLWTWMMLLSCGVVLSGCSSGMKIAGPTQSQGSVMLEDDGPRDQAMIQSVSKQKGPEPLPQEMAPWMTIGETKPSGMLQDESSGELRSDGDASSRRKENTNDPVPVPEEPQP